MFAGFQLVCVQDLPAVQEQGQFSGTQPFKHLLPSRRSALAAVCARFKMLSDYFSHGEQGCDLDVNFIRRCLGLASGLKLMKLVFEVKKKAAFPSALLKDVCNPITSPLALEAFKSPSRPAPRRIIFC